MFEEMFEGEIYDLKETIGELRAELATLRAAAETDRAEIARLRELLSQAYEHIEDQAEWHKYYCKSTYATGLPCDCDGGELRKKIYAALEKAE